MPAPTVVDHPLLKVVVSTLRDRDTTPGEFREAVERAALLLAPEALRDLPLQERVVETPLERTVGHAPAVEVVLVPILRAGMGMTGAFLRFVPGARVAHLGLRRDEKTLRPEEYYARLPDRLELSYVVVLDPMLATGGSALAALRRVKERGARRVVFACLFAAPEGVASLSREHPDVRIVTAALDRGLDAHGYIRPGLGDAGDRIFGTLP